MSRQERKVLNQHQSIARRRQGSVALVTCSIRGSFVTPLTGWTQTFEPDMIKSERVFSATCQLLQLAQTDLVI